MKLKNYLISLLILTASISFAQDINQYKAVMNDYPAATPNGGVPDAPLTGNGDIGLTMRAYPQSLLRFYIGKNDFWRFIPSYPLGAVALPGGLDIQAEQIECGKYYAEELPGSAEIRATFDAKRYGKLQVNAWVAATDNKIVIELESNVKTQVLINLWGQVGAMGVVNKGTYNNCTWVTRAFENMPHLERNSYVALSVNRSRDIVYLQPGKKETILITAYTNFDAPDWKDKAIKEACTFKDFDKLKADHKKWWDDFWKLSHVTLSDSILEKNYYLSQYIFACSSRSGKFAPGLYGPFATHDYRNWAGDYHLNYDYEAPFWDSYSSNHIILADNYDAPLLDAMEKGREYAKKILNKKGIDYPVGLGPLGLISSSWDIIYDKTDHSNECGAQFWQQKTNASFAATNMLMRFYSTYDTAYAKRIYPYILACTDFWEDYLTYEDGKYQVKNDIFYETDPYKNTTEENSVTTLGLVKMTVKGAIDISKFLGVDKNRLKKWNDIVNNLYPYPTGKDENGQLTARSIIAKTYEMPLGSDPELEYRIVLQGTVYPAAVVGPLLDPEYNKILLRDIERWEGWMNDRRDWGKSFGNGFETNYAAAVRVGYPAQKVIHFMKDRIRRQCYPNGWIHQGGGGVESLSGVPSAVNEMLLQSFENVLRIFPNWDRTKDASFENLRAYGAFLVSSSIKNGQIGTVKILSEKGRPCKIENPWPGKSIQIKSSGSSPKTMKGQYIEFKTSPNQEIEITPVL